MKMHEMAGKPVKITSGKLKGKYFIVIDWLVNQYQGKDIGKIAKSHPGLVGSVVNRGNPLDDQIVFGRLYPDMNFTCVHDKELLDAEPAELTSNNVISIAAKRKEKKDDTGTTSKRDNESTSTGSPEPTDGRSVPSAEVPGQAEGSASSQGSTDSIAGSTAGITGTGETGSDKPEAPKRVRASRTNKSEGGK